MSMMFMWWFVATLATGVLGGCIFVDHRRLGIAVIAASFGFLGLFYWQSGLFAAIFR